MSDVVLLSDTVTNTVLGDSRYMGPYALASELEKAGFSVVVIDYFTRHPDFFSFLEKFITPQTLFIGVSSTFLAKAPTFPKLANESYREILVDSLLSKNGNNREEFQSSYNQAGLWFDDADDLINWTLKCRSVLTKKNPNGKLVLGGAKTSLLLHKKAIIEFDFIALSAADHAIVDLAKKLKKNESPNFKLNGSLKVLNNEADLKEKFCPTSNFSPKHAIKFKESLPIEISRGCIFSCKFCHYDKKESFRKNLNTLRDEFIRNYELFGTQVYHFCDDCFNDSKVKVLETCAMMQSLPFKLEWISYARIDLCVYHPETLEAMINSGAKGLFFGIESFNDDAIKRAGKKVPSEKIKQCLIESYQKYSAQCLFEGSFIIGLPGEDVDSINKTIEWLTNNKAFDFISAARLYLQPYTQEYDNVSIDYSDYSRKPDEFGITKKNNDATTIEWEHSTMNSSQASQLTKEFLHKWAQNGKNTIFRNIFDYPILRTLDFSKEEIWLMAKDETQASHWGKLASQRYTNFLEQYWKKLIEENL